MEATKWLDMFIVLRRIRHIQKHMLKKWTVHYGNWAIIPFIDEVGGHHQEIETKEQRALTKNSFSCYPTD